ncbi:MAG: metallophosphoesterase [Nitrososphaeraceae archaeon]
MKSSFLMIILGMMIIISFYSYSLPDGYAIQQQSATAQPPSQLPLPQTGGEGQQQSGTENLIVAAVGDSKAESEAKVTFTNIKNEKPDTFVFLGDASYIDDNGKVWTDLIDSIGLKEIIQVIKGNHEDKEESAEKAGQDMENWMPSLKEAKNGAIWLSSKQVKNAYFINMNGQDLDYQFSDKGQYAWVKEELDKAVKLRSEGKIEWIFVSFHQPIYSLKTIHTPEQNARDIYQPLFDAAQVDFVLQGHNHDMQLWLPMSYNGQQLFTKLADGTFDFSKQHGQFYMINGAAGRGLTPFSQDPKTNTNVMFANDEDLGYSVFYIQGKELILQYKSNAGEILHQIKVVKDQRAVAQQIPSIEKQSQPGFLLLATNIINDNGGTKLASNFTINIAGNTSTPSFQTLTLPEIKTVSIEEGKYSLAIGDIQQDEYSVYVNNIQGYSVSPENQCEGEIKSGEVKTCLITIDDDNEATAQTPSPLPPQPQIQ